MPQLEIIKPNGEIEFLSLAPNGGIINIGSDPQNDVVLNNPAVAPFHAFLDYRASPARFVLLGKDESQASFVNHIETGGYTLIFLKQSQPDIETTPIPPTNSNGPIIDKPYYDFSVGKLQPRRRTLGWFKTFAQFNLSVSNTGTREAQIFIHGNYDESTCYFEFALPGQPVTLTGQVALKLLPEEKIIVPVKVAPMSRPLISFRRPAHFFSLAVGLPAHRQLARSIPGELICKPLIGPGVLVLLFVFLLLAGWLSLPRLLHLLQVDPPVIAERANVADTVDVFPFSRQVDNLPEPAPADIEDSNTPNIPYEQMFREIAPQYGLDWHVLEALAYYESRMNYLAVGKAGDMGLMQIIPATWGQWAPKVNAADPFDPYSNIKVGAVFLAEMRDFCGSRGYSDPRWMLVAYNWGPNRLEKFWNDGGDWEQIPEVQRRYAAGIIDLATQRATTLAPSEEFYPDVPAGVDFP